jgi:hypothetical protein
MESGKRGTGQNITLFLRGGKRALKEEHHTEGTEVTEVRSKINQKSNPHRRSNVNEGQVKYPGSVLFALCVNQRWPLQSQPGIDI